MSKLLASDGMWGLAEGFEFCLQKQREYTVKAQALRTCPVLEG